MIDNNQIGQPSTILKDFEQMADQMRDMLKSLEERVENRTRDLEIAAEVSRQVTSILNTEELLPYLVGLTRDSFHLYHAHIYLLDEAGEKLVLTAGAGDVGRQMASTGHSIPLDKENSLVAQAARTHQPIVVNDVSQDENFLPNKLLPDTKSEMAVPMVVGNNVIGVLDVQADVVDRFTNAEVQVQTTLASQIAVAIQNARTFEKIQKQEQILQESLSELRGINSALDEFAIVAVTDQRGLILSVNDNFCKISKYSREELIGQDHRMLNSSFHSKEFIRSLWVTIANGEIWNGEIRNKAKDGSFYWVDTTIVPLLNAQGKPYRYVAIRRDVTERRALEEQNRRRAVEFETVAKVSAAASTTLDIQTLLQDAVELTKANFNLYHAHIYLLDEAGEKLVLAAGAGEIGTQMVAAGHSIPMDKENSLVAQAARTRQGVIVNDVSQDENFLPNALLPETKSEMAVPMIAGDKVIGVLDVQGNVTNRFGNLERQAKTTLASQLAVAIENARAFESVQKAREEVERVYNSSIDMISTVGFDGYIKTLNPAWSKALGWTLEELTRSPYVEFVHPDDVDRTNREVTEQLGAGLTVLSFENRYRSKDGSYRWFSWNGIPDVEAGLIYCGTRDVTEQKRVQDAIRAGEERYRSLTTATAQIVWNTDPQGAVIEDLPYWREYTGQTFEETKGWGWLSAVHPDDQPNSAKVWQAALDSKGLYEVEQRIRRHDGVYRDFAARGVPIFNTDGSIREWIGTCTDITESKKQEDEIRRRAIEMETVAKVGAAAATNLDVNTLLQDAVELTKANFKLYHAHIYLLDEAGEHLVLTAGAGEIGAQMVATGYSIPLDKENSLVAQAARSREGVIVNDVSRDANFLPNKLLPDTKSEMAVPMVAGDTLIGVLDVQGNVTNRFGELEKQAKITLASQIAVAIQNARFFQETQDALAQTEALYSGSERIVHADDMDAIVSALLDSTSLGKMDRVNVLIFDQPWNETQPETMRSVSIWDRSKDGFVPPNLIYELSSFPFLKIVSRDEPFISADTTSDARIDDNARAVLKQIGATSFMLLPLVTGDDWIGFISTQSRHAQTFAPAEVRRIATLSKQAAAVMQTKLQEQAINIAREQSDKRAVEFETVARISTAAATTLDIKTLLQDAVELTKTNFNLYHAHIYLLDEADEHLVLTAGAGEIGAKLVAAGHSIPLDKENSLVARAARTREGVIVNDVSQDENFLPNKLLPETKSEMAVPMIAGDKVIGVLDVQGNVTNRFGNLEKQAKTTLASQLAVAIENARAYEQIQKQEQTLQESLSELRGINSALDEFAIVAVTDQRGVILSVNDNFCKISKYSRDELIGQDHRLLNSGYHSKEFIRDLWVTIANGNIWNGEIKNRAKDGSYYWVDTTIVPLLNAQSKPYRYVAIRRDVTERRALEEQARKRAVEMETVAKVSAAATTNLDVAALLQEAVELTKANFNLYHTHIYLLDEVGENLVLAAGAGEVGAQMVMAGRSIPVKKENSLVAQAARTRQGVIVNDVSQDENFLPNALLPETKSEMAVPMVVGDKVIGVLDVQGNVTNQFSELEKQTQTTLASQLAVAIQNARAVEQTQKALASTEALYQGSERIIHAKNLDELLDGLIETTALNEMDRVSILLFDRPWNDIRPSTITVVSSWDRDTGGFAESNTVYPLDLFPVINQMDANKPFTSIDVLTDERLNENERTALDRIKSRSIMIVPLSSGDEWIGMLSGSSYQKRQLTEDQIRQIDALAGQSVSIIQNMLAEETQAVLYESSTGLAKAQTAAELLEAVIGYARRKDAASGVLLYIDEDTNGQPEWAQVAASWPDNLPGTEIGTKFYLPELPFSHLWMSNPNAPSLVDDVMTSPLVDESTRQIFAMQGTHGSAILPLYTQGRWTALYAFSWQNPHIFTAQEQEVYESIIRQATSAVEAVRSAEATLEAKQRAEMLAAESARRAVEFETVAKVGTAATTAHDIQTLLQETVDLTKANFNQYHIQIYLMDSVEENLVLTAGAGEVGAKLVAAGHSIPLDKENSLVAKSARTREGVIVNDVSQDENFLPNALLPETKAEMAIPLVVGAKVIGVLDVQANVTNRFGNIEKQAKVVLASQIAAAIQNARAFEQIQKQEQILQESLSELRGLNSALDKFAIVAVTDQRGIILSVNDNFCKISKYSREELIGQDHRMLNSSYHPKEFIRDLWVTIANGEIWSGEIRNKAKDGSHYWVDTTIVPLLNAQGKPYRYVAIRRDVTERRALEAQNRERATKLETVSVVSAATTTILDVEKLLQSVADLTKISFGLYHAHIYLLDEAGEKLVLAAGADEAGAKMVAAGHNIPLSRENSLVVQAALTRNGIIANNVSQNPDFLPNPLLPETKSELAVPMIVGNELIGVMDFQSDEFDRFTQEDVGVKTALANQVAVAVKNARAFEYQRSVADRLREVDRLKSEFLANMSHELRTPLNSIIGYSEVLLDGIDGDLTDDAVEDVRAIHGSGQHLLNIINDILDLAKIEAGQMRIDRSAVELNTFISDIARTAQILVKNKPVELVVNQEANEIRAYADPIRLRQIVWNLVNNAIKFTEQGSVTIHIGANEDGQAVIKVADTGIGMKPEDLPLLFEQFRQVDGSSTRRAGGTGLGLHITRHLVRMHEGDIHVESEFGSGSTFWFTLPLFVGEMMQR